MFVGYFGIIYTIIVYNSCVINGITNEYELNGYNTGNSNDIKIIKGSPGGLIILTNNNDVCIIDCNNKDMCKYMGYSFRLYSACKTTIINCGEASCKNAVFNIGTLSDELIPSGYSMDSFNGIKHGFILNCDSKQGCLGITLNIIGEFLYGIKINGKQNNALYSSNINCDNNCEINCDNYNACNDLTINCDGNCVCNGGCHDLKYHINTIINTASPTSPTIQPTYEPTHNPTLLPSINPTQSKIITYVPDSNGGIYVCKNNVGTCNLECNNIEQQCGSGVVFLSSANNTNILCDNKDACKNIEIYIGNTITDELLESLELNDNSYEFINNASQININCSSEAACKDSLINIDINIENSIELLTLNNIDALKDSHIHIITNDNSKCNLNCNDTGCKDAIFYNPDQCLCYGESCPIIDNNIDIYTDITTTRIQSNNQTTQNDIINVFENESNNNHYPNIIHIFIISSICMGLISIIVFMIFYKCFIYNNDIKREEALLHNNVDNIRSQNHIKYNSFP